MTTTDAKTTKSPGRFRLPDPPEREPDDMTSAEHLSQTGFQHHLKQFLGNPETTIVSGEKYIIARPGAEPKYPDLLVAFRLARPLPAGVDVRAMQVIERAFSVRRGRNRPAHDRSYDVRLVVWVDDPLARSDFLNPVGLDIGKAILVAASDGECYSMPKDALECWLERRAHHRERQQRCKHGSRQWVKRRNAIRDCNRKIGNIKTNAERHIAAAVTDRHDAVIVEKLRVSNMKRSARGTMENPGRNVTAKRGLNRTLAEIRPGALSRTLERRCEKTGTPFAAVDAHYTSQRCSECGYTDRENRKKQAEFLCLMCRHAANADHNAARNVLFRGAVIYLCCILVIRYAEAGARQHCGRTGVPSLADPP